MAKEEDKKAVKQKRPSAQKSLIQSEKRRDQNKMFRSRFKTAIRHFKECVAKKDKETAKVHLSELSSLVDKGVNRGLFKRNKAARTKARMMARANQLLAA